MSKIVNEAKIGHLRSGLLPLLPDVHCLHRRRFSAWPSRYVQKMQLDDQPVTGTAARRVPSSHKQYCAVSAALFLAVLQKTTTRPDSCTSANCPGVFYAF